MSLREPERRQEADRAGPEDALPWRVFLHVGLPAAGHRHGREALPHLPAGGDVPRHRHRQLRRDRTEAVPSQRDTL